MNIFRKKYGIVKSRLALLGGKLSATALDLLCSESFWKNYYRKIPIDGWDFVIARYMALECTVEERKFINAAFFRDRSPAYIEIHLHISQGMYYLWRERIFNDLIFLACRENLISLDISDDSAAHREWHICDKLWEKIVALIPATTVVRSRNIRKEVEAMAFVQFTGAKWSDLPKEYGPWKTAYNRFNTWKKTGLWESIKKLLLEYGGVI